MASRELEAAVQDVFTHQSNNDEEVKIAEPVAEVENHFSPSELKVSDEKKEDKDGVDTHFSNLVSAAVQQQVVEGGTEGIFVHKDILSENEQEGNGDKVEEEPKAEKALEVEPAPTPVAEEEEVKEEPKPIVEAEEESVPAPVVKEEEEPKAEEDKAPTIEDELVEGDAIKKEDGNIEDELVDNTDEEEAYEEEELNSAFSDQDLENPAVATEEETVKPCEDNVLTAKENEPVPPQQSTTELSNGTAPQQAVEVPEEEITCYLVDADDMADNKVDDLDFVDCGNMIHVLRANRIVASLSKKKAQLAGKREFLELDSFADIVTHECQQQGLRAGLESCGFALAKVCVKGSTVLKHQVEAGSKKLEAALAEQKFVDGKCWQQCLALACEGINRKMFPGYTNPLRASLISTLQTVGIGQAEKVIRAAFRDNGTETMKQIVALATKLQAMPEDVRDNIAQQLDMTVEPDEDMLDGNDEYLGDDVVESINKEDEYFDDEPVNAVEAAFANPLRRATKRNNITAGAEKDDVLSRLKGLSFSLY